MNAPAAAPMRTPGLAATGQPRPIRVLFVADHLGYGGGVIHGASTYYLRVLPRFDPARVRPTLCILRDEHPFAEDLRRAGVRTIFLRRAKWDPRAAADLLRLVRRTEPDVLHLLTMKSSILGRLVGRITGRPSLVHLHDLNDPGPVIRTLMRRTASWSDLTLAVSEPVRRFAVATLGARPDRTRVLPNALETAEFAVVGPEARAGARLELGLALNIPLIAVFGRIVPEKGQHALIAALPRILERCPDARLMVVGDGPHAGACRALAADLGLADRVLFTGQRSSIVGLLAAADVVAVPSLCEEGFGYTALEAAAAGRPVVAFASGALRDVVQDGRTGLLVPPGDAAAMAAALTRVLGDRALALRLGRAGRARAVAYDIQEHIRRLGAIYASLAHKAP